MTLLLLSILEQYSSDMFNQKIWDVLGIARSTWGSSKHNRKLAIKHYDNIYNKIGIDDYQNKSEKEICLEILKKYDWTKK